MVDYAPTCKNILKEVRAMDEQTVEQHFLQRLICLPNEDNIYNKYLSIIYVHTIYVTNIDCIIKPLMDTSSKYKKNWHNLI